MPQLIADRLSEPKVWNFRKNSPTNSRAASSSGQDGSLADTVLCVCHDLFGVPQEETPDREGFRAFWLGYVHVAVGSRDVNQKMGGVGSRFRG